MEFSTGDILAVSSLAIAAAAIYMIFSLRKTINQPQVVMVPPNPEAYSRNQYYYYYGSEVDRLRKQVDMYRKMLEAKEREFKERLKELSEKATMLQSLNDAIKAGKVKLTCPEHKDAEVTLLIDGTMICSKGHRLWPPSPEEAGK